jgi:hypothetical protein
MSDPWPRTQHWLRDHKSHHITQAQLRHLGQLNRPLVPQVCGQCAWPASIGEFCMLCCDMAEAILPQPGLVRAHEQWRQMRLQRRMGLL